MMKSLKIAAVVLCALSINNSNAERSKVKIDGYDHEGNPTYIAVNKNGNVSVVAGEGKNQKTISKSATKQILVKLDADVYNGFADAQLIAMLYYAKEHSAEIFEWYRNGGNKVQVNSDQGNNEDGSKESTRKKRTRRSRKLNTKKE